MDFEVRKLEDKDFEDIDTRLAYFRTLRGLTSAESMPQEVCKLALHRGTKTGSKFYIAIQEKEIIGTASLMTPQNGSNMSYLEDVVTRNGFRGQGVMKALIEKIIDENSNEQITLDCEKKLIPYYRKNFGFRRKNKKIQVRHNLRDPRSYSHLESYPGIIENCFIEQKFTHNGARVMHITSNSSNQGFDLNYARSSSCYKAIAIASVEDLKDWEKKGFKPKSPKPEYQMVLKK